jgi:hypothetical protein
VHGSLFPGCCKGMPGTRVSRRGGAQFHGPWSRVSGAFLLPDGFRSWLVLVEAECEHGDLGFAGDGVQAARAAASAAAASA